MLPTWSTQSSFPRTPKTGLSSANGAPTLCSTLAILSSQCALCSRCLGRSCDTFRLIRSVSQPSWQSNVLHFLRSLRSFNARWCTRKSWGNTIVILYSRLTLLTTWAICEKSKAWSDSSLVVVHGFPTAVIDCLRQSPAAIDALAAIACGNYEFLKTLPRAMRHQPAIEPVLLHLKIAPPLVIPHPAHDLSR